VRHDGPERGELFADRVVEFRANLFSYGSVILLAIR